VLHQGRNVTVVANQYVKALTHAVLLPHLLEVIKDFLTIADWLFCCVVLCSAVLCYFAFMCCSALCCVALYCAAVHCVIWCCAFMTCSALSCVERCCWILTVLGGLGCALKLGAKCSPMAQPCCTEACAPTKRHQVCSASHECMQEAICTLETAECPQPEMKHNGALCSSRTKVCL